MRHTKNQIGVTDILLLAVSAVFLLGILTVFGPCGPKDDGSWMTCHWAGRAAAGLAAVLTAIALVHLLLPDAKVRLGLDLATLPVALLALILPGNLISLCMMNTMHCHTVMRPAVTVMSILVAAAAVFDAVIQRGKTK